MVIFDILFVSLNNPLHFSMVILLKYLETVTFSCWAIWPSYQHSAPWTTPYKPTTLPLYVLFNSQSFLGIWEHRIGIQRFAFIHAWKLVPSLYSSFIQPWISDLTSNLSLTVKMQVGWKIHTKSVVINDLVWIVHFKRYSVLLLTLPDYAGDAYQRTLSYVLL